MFIRAYVLFLFTALLAAPAMAQDLQGNDTAGNWKVRHFETFGIWNSICDEREEHGSLVQRCYLRYVDVFSPAPNFAAQFLFVTPEGVGAQVEFGLEPGTLFSPNGFRIDQNGETTWRTRRPGCLTGLSCDFEGDRATDLLQAMAAGGDMRFVFIDRHGKAQDLSWPLKGFDAALADFYAQSKARDLMPAS